MEQTNPLPNSPVSSQAPETPPVNTSSSKKSILIILSVILLVVLSSSVTYLLVKSQTAYPTPSAPPITVQPTPTPDPTANWKTYTNTEYKYSIKYPTNWTVSSLPGTDISTFHEPLFSSSCNLDNYESCNQIFLLAARYNSTAKIYEGDIVYSSGKIQNKTKINVVGTEAEGFEFLENEKFRYFVTVIKNDIKFIFMFGENKKGKVYKYASDWENKIIFDQVLSTFKFTEQKCPEGQVEKQCKRGSCCCPIDALCD